MLITVTDCLQYIAKYFIAVVRQTKKRMSSGTVLGEVKLGDASLERMWAEKKEGENDEEEEKK